MLIPARPLTTTIAFFVVLSHRSCVAHDDDNDSDSECKIYDLTVSEQTHNSFLVRWNSDCQSVEQYKVYATHKFWKACREGDFDNDPKISHFEVGETTNDSFRVENLQPYSDYEVEVMGILENGRTISANVTSSTKSWIPETVPQLKGEARAYKQAIKIHWTLSDDCQLFNGFPNGTRVQVFGVDPWVLSDEPIKEQTLGKFLDFTYIDRLQPYTRYKVKIYQVNENDQWNPNKALELMLQTQSDQPRAPTDIKLIPNVSSISLQWLAPYPPTGLVEKFVIRVGRIIESNHIWIKRQEVLRRNGVCKGSMKSAESQEMCWEVKKLEPNTEYIVEIQTWNEDVQKPSEFSFSVHVTTENRTQDEITSQGNSTSSTLAFNGISTSRSPQKTIKNVNNGPGTWVIIPGVFAVIMLIAVITLAVFYKLQAKKILEKSYVHQPNSNSEEISAGSPPYSNRRSLDSTYTSVMSTFTDTTLISRQSRRSSSSNIPSRSSQIEAIQSRRLPEPPPINETPVSPISKSLSPLQASTPNSASRALPINYSHPYNSPQDSGFSVNETTSQDQKFKHTDIEGYLDPGFFKTDSKCSPQNRKIIATSDIRNVDEDDEDDELDDNMLQPRSLIPMESYQVPKTTSPDLDRSIDGSMNSSIRSYSASVMRDSEPLIVSDTVQV